PRASLGGGHPARRPGGGIRPAPQARAGLRAGRGPAIERLRRAPALWRRGEVQLDRLAAGTRARLGGEFSGAGLKDQRRDLLGAVDADPGAEQPAARAVATRLVRCQSETLAHHASTLGQRRGGRGLHDGPTTTPSASTSKSSSFHSPGEREVEARLRTRDDMANSVNQSLETGASPVANWAPNQVLGLVCFFCSKIATGRLKVVARRAQEDFCGTLSAKGAWRAGCHRGCTEPRSGRTDC